MHINALLNVYEHTYYKGKVWVWRIVSGQNCLHVAIAIATYIIRHLIANHLHGKTLKQLFL